MKLWYPQFLRKTNLGTYALKIDSLTNMEFWKGQLISEKINLIFIYVVQKTKENI